MEYSIDDELSRDRIMHIWIFKEDSFIIGLGFFLQGSYEVTLLFLSLLNVRKHGCWYGFLYTDYKLRWVGRGTRPYS